jgi:hypothetical protein
MGADCCSPRRRWSSVGLAYTPAALLAILVPKCPMCLGVMLGVGMVLPRQSYALLVIGSAGLGTWALVWRLWLAPRRRRQGALSGD